MNEVVGASVDVLFAIRGTSLAADHRFLLLQQLTRHLPWLETEIAAGVHPLRSAHSDDGRLLLSRRVKLILRLPMARVDDALELTGKHLDIGDASLQVGTAVVRPLRPFGTLYAYFVAARSDDEDDFVREVSGWLGELSAPCSVVCGRRHALRAGERRVAGYSLMLHDLAPEHSLLLQQVGLGSDRKLGCGILVPHRSAAAANA
jgi:CRISPR-associated protein Cas6